MQLNGEAAVEVAAAPEAVYDLVADVTRMGDWSPECRRCAWANEARQAVPGARFRGWNRWKGMRWSRLNEVVVADRGQEFAFRTIPGFPYRDSTLWSYRFEPAPDGRATRVTESFNVVKAGPIIKLFERVSGRPDQTRAALHATLARIKAAAESSMRASSCTPSIR